MDKTYILNQIKKKIKIVTFLNVRKQKNGHFDDNI